MEDSRARAWPTAALTGVVLAACGVSISSDDAVLLRGSRGAVPVGVLAGVPEMQSGCDSTCAADTAVDMLDMLDSSAGSPRIATLAGVAADPPACADAALHSPRRFQKAFQEFVHSQRKARGGESALRGESLQEYRNPVPERSSRTNTVQTGELDGRLDGGPVTWMGRQLGRQGMHPISDGHEVLSSISDPSTEGNSDVLGRRLPEIGGAVMETGTTGSSDSRGHIDAAIDVISVSRVVLSA